MMIVRLIAIHADCHIHQLHIVIVLLGTRVSMFTLTVTDIIIFFFTIMPVAVML